MDIFELQIDEQALENAHEQINYYNNIPKHIRGTVSEFKFKIETIAKDSIGLMPAHVIEGLITVKGGSMNIPGLAFAY